MTIDLLNMIILFRKDSKYFTNIVSLFDSKLHYLNYKLNYPEAYTDLLIYLYELLYKINLDKFIFGIEVYKYINICLNNKSKQLYQRNRLEPEYNSLSLNLLLLDPKDSNDCFSNILFNDLISLLPYRQRLILFYKFYLQYSDIEIANILKISRQAVNKSKRNALSKLKLQLS